MLSNPSNGQTRALSESGRISFKNLANQIQVDFRCKPKPRLIKHIKHKKFNLSTSEVSHEIVDQLKIFFYNQRYWEHKQKTLMLSTSPIEAFNEGRE